MAGKSIGEAYQGGKKPLVPEEYARDYIINMLGELITIAKHSGQVSLVGILKEAKLDCEVADED